MSASIHYITEDDVKALIPAPWLTEALDDAAIGTDGAWDVVLQAAEDAVNGELSTQYEVPIKESLPFLRHVTRLEVARLCYTRRNMAEQFPHQTAWVAAWKKLGLIGTGDLQLSPANGTNAELARPRGEVISAPSRTHSTGSTLTA